MSRRALPLLAALAVAIAAPAAAGAAPRSAPKLRGGLAEIVSGKASLDARIPGLVRGYRAGEIPYFVVLRGRATPAREAALRRLGARILNRYSAVDAYAVASRPAAVRRVARLPWVAWASPVEVVRAQADPVADQTRGTAADVGGAALWSQGITGKGVRIAILDTGIDAAHPDVDDQDFGTWSALTHASKVVDARSFVSPDSSTRVCGAPLSGATDGHGHGTHVAGVAAGTGEATDPAQNGRYAGVAPGAELAVGKVMTDAGTGLNSDLLTAMEWAAMPAGSLTATCGLVAPAVGADIVNLSLGSESRPLRLNSGQDTDLVSITLNRLAARYGTLFVVAAGNSGPYVGSVLESPGSAAQALSVGATAKDWDVNHDDTLAGDTCAAWQLPAGQASCSPLAASQRSSVSAFSSRGPTGDLWLRPDVVAPGYDIVSAEASAGAALKANDLNTGTRGDPLYATATGTSMASPATAGTAALVLQAYRDRYGAKPSGASGVTGFTAPAYALVRAALMNSAQADLWEARWILSVTDGTVPSDYCPEANPPLPTIPTFTTFCELGLMPADILASAFRTLVLYQPRNQGSDPYVGPLAEGAGKVDAGRAIAALRDGVVAYSTASGTGADTGTGPRDLQGTWQIGAIGAGAVSQQRFVLHAAPGAATTTASFAWQPGNPSDGSRAMTTGTGGWTVKLPGKTQVRPGKDVVVTLSATAPGSAAPGNYTGRVVVTLSNGQTLRIPVYAAVALHDTSTVAGNTPGPQAQVVAAQDVYAKGDTVWPSVAGSSGTGTSADWLVYPVTLGSGLARARFTVWDTAAGDETYDLYLYGAGLGLVASTHPFSAPGITNQTAARSPSTASSPQVLEISAPAAGRYYLVVSRSVVGGTSTGDFGRFTLTLDEAR